MFRLENSLYLWGLALIPVIWMVFYFAARQMQSRWAKLGNQKNVQSAIIPSDEVHFFKKYFIYILVSLAIISLANPQFGQKKEKIRSQNVDIYILLDVSKSMLATDIQPNRLSRAQIWIKQFTERFPSERIGLISFAGNAYLQSPLTTDAATIQMLSSSVSPSTVAMQGTSIAAAIEVARKSFPQKEGFHKTIVILSDGEDHEGEAIEQAKQAKEEGITIFTIPIGSESGGAVPNINNAAEPFQRNEKGDIIKTIPNRKLLNDIADAAQGELIEIDEGQAGFDMMKKRFAALAKKELTYQSFSEYQSYFQWPLFFILILLAIEIIWKKNKT